MMQKKVAPLNVSSNKNSSRWRFIEQWLLPLNSCRQLYLSLSSFSTSFFSLFCLLACLPAKTDACCLAYIRTRNHMAGIINYNCGHELHTLRLTIPRDICNRDCRGSTQSLSLIDTTYRISCKWKLIKERNTTKLQWLWDYLLHLIAWTWDDWIRWWRTKKFWLELSLEKISSWWI